MLGGGFGGSGGAGGVGGVGVGGLAGALDATYASGSVSPHLRKSVAEIIEDAKQLHRSRKLGASLGTPAP